MRLLVFPHRLDVGGSQINAIELAGAVRDLGHDVRIVSYTGPLEAMIRDLNLPFHPLRKRRTTGPSVQVVRRLSELVDEARPDVVHAWEPNACLESFAAATVRRGVAVVGSLMGFWIPSFLPRSMLLTVGTEEMRRVAARRRGDRAVLLEPPIDTDRNAPMPDAGMAFRAEHGITADEVVVTIVSRLVGHLKFEGVARTIRAVASLGSTPRLRLVVVGSGEASAEVAELAAAANVTAGRDLVLLTGEIVDPRPAYAAADVVVGMGSSSLRGMAFSKPVVVIGERGFSETFEPASMAAFLDRGFYGLGDPVGDRLPEQLGRLARDRGLRRELGAFGRAVVEERFSLRTAAQRLEALYGRALERRAPARTRLVEPLLSGVGFGADRIARRLGAARQGSGYLRRDRVA